MKFQFAEQLPNWLKKFGKHSAITCKPGSTVPDIVCYCLHAYLIVRPPKHAQRETRGR